MSGMWGNKIKISIFGESHGNAIGINLDGLEPGFEIDLDKVSAEMKEEHQVGITYQHQEKKLMNLRYYGFFEGRTTGLPLCHHKK